jgi:HPt (histidine-containing phosphotransfer) domain-containing protein
LLQKWLPSDPTESGDRLKEATGESNDNGDDDTETMTTGESFLATVAKTQRSGKERKNTGANERVDFSFDLLEKHYGSSATEIASLFINGLPPQMVALREASTTRNMTAALQCAHDIKSGAATVFAESIVQTCLDLEKAGKNNDWAALRLHIEELADCIKIAEKYARSQQK